MKLPVDSIDLLDAVLLIKLNAKRASDAGLHDIAKRHLALARRLVQPIADQNSCTNLCLELGVKGSGLTV